MNTLVEKLEVLAKVVPTSWLDPLLSGPEKVVHESPCPEIEALLNAVRKRLKDGILALLAEHAKEGEGLPLADEHCKSVGWTLNVDWMEKIQSEIGIPDGEEGSMVSLETVEAVLLAAKSSLASRPAPAAPDALREAIRARMRLYDSQVDPGCIGTGYDATDIITMSELRQLVGFERAALSGSPRKE